MTSAVTKTHREDRVLILAPTGRDADLTVSFLSAAGIPAEICVSMLDLVHQVEAGCAGIIVAEEALGSTSVQMLLDLLARQPSWSEISIVVITSGGDATTDSLQRLTIFGPSGNVTLLERPFRPMTLINSALAAQRSRRRQYQVRDLLRERETVLTSINDAFVTLDRHWRYTYVNDKAAALAGRSREELLGRNIWESFPHIVTTPLYAELHRAMAEQVNLRFEHYQEAQQRWLDVRIYPSPDGVSILSAEVTESKKQLNLLQQSTEALRLAKEELSVTNRELEQRVADRTQQLTESNEQLEAFVYSIAHDLRAPLRAMQAYAALLLEEHEVAMNTSARHYAQRIVRSAESMDRLIIDLLAYGRISRSELALGVVPLEAAWKAALAQCEKDIHETGATIITSSPLPAVMAHEATLTQVFANLLSNAVKFMAPGVSPVVRLRAESVHPWVRVCLEDNGIGIAPEHQRRIFRVFERLNGSVYPGTGIGLSIVRKGVERMNGRVGLESKVGQGSQFWIELSPAKTEAA